MGVISRRWMWVECMGVASGFGCEEVYRFPHITYPYSSCSYLFFFCSSIPTFCSFFKCFSLFIIESVDSISRDERDVPLTQYITNA